MPALLKSLREAEEKPKADDRARETQPALVVRRRTVVDTVGIAIGKSSGYLMSL